MIRFFTKKIFFVARRMANHEDPKFNSWVIGGSYSKTQMKRNQIRTDLAVHKRFALNADGDELDRKLEARKVALREHNGQAPQYKPKFAEAMREERKRQADETSALRDSSPRRADRGERTVTAGHDPRPPSNEATSAELRLRLRQSFEQPQQQRGLFPPLLLPYDRPMTFLRGRDRAVKVVRAGPTFPTPTTAVAEQQAHAFSLPTQERRRALPSSGPQPFFPTGSSTTAYRHFTNYGLLARMSAANPEGFTVSANSLQ
jgi:hypothetical protein